MRRPRRGSATDRARTAHVGVAFMGRHVNPAVVKLAPVDRRFLPEEPMPESSPRVHPVIPAARIAMALAARALAAAAIAALALALPVPALAHSGAPPAAEKPSEKAHEFKLEKLTDRVFCLYGRGGNVGFLVTDAGVVVVDDQYREVAEGIVVQIRSVTDRPIRFMVNTHYHGDHTGGNPVFIKLAEIVAHNTVRPRLLEYPETIRMTFPARVQAIETEIAGLKDAADPYRLALEKDRDLLGLLLKSAQAFSLEAAAPPGITYEGEVRLWLGDQEGDGLHIAPGHTDGDSIVFFRKEKVLHMGDLFFNGLYPFIDALAGGSGRGYVRNLERILPPPAPRHEGAPGPRPRDRRGHAAAVPLLHVRPRRRGREGRHGRPIEGGCRP